MDANSAEVRNVQQQRQKSFEAHAFGHNDLIRSVGDRRFAVNLDALRPDTILKDEALKDAINKQLASRAFVGERVADEG